MNISIASWVSMFSSSSLLSITSLRLVGYGKVIDSVSASSEGTY